MANEFAWDFESGSTLYAARFQLDGDVFLTSGASDETWGTGGRDADYYDVTVPEKGSGGHYVGSFDASGNISAGVYRVTVYLQDGASPADGDLAIARGEIHWDGTAEINMSTADTKIDDEVVGADGDSNEDLSDQMDILSAQKSQVLNVYDERN